MDLLRIPWNPEALQLLPRRPEETWECISFRLPAWSRDEKTGEHYRPDAFAWVSDDAGQRVVPLRRGEEPSAAVLDSLQAAMIGEEGFGRLPGSVAVMMPELAEVLGDALTPLGIRVGLKEELRLAEVAVIMLREEIYGQPESEPGCLEGKGVDVGRVRAFADAAAEYYRARPWRHINSLDLVQVKSYKPEARMGWFSIMGKPGDEDIAIAFFSSMQEWNDALKASLTRPPGEELYPPKPGSWAMGFRAVHEIPIADSELWERENLPLAGPNAYPVVMRYGRTGLRKPDTKRLAFLEGLLRAMAGTTGDDIDSAGWEKTVQTCDGPCTCRLAMPLLTLPIIPDNPAPPTGPMLDHRSMERLMLSMSRHMAAQKCESPEEAGNEVRKRFLGKRVMHAPGSTPLEQAQDIIYQAYEAGGRRRIQMARRALEICPDCADAHVTLAECAFDREEAFRRWNLGVEAGRKNLGRRIFSDPNVTFWARLETRPFMRALLGRGRALMKRRQFEEARRDVEELLELNPGDNQGVRYLYVELLLLSGADRDLLEFIREHGEDLSPIGSYARALALYRLDPASPDAAAALDEGISSHVRIARFLLGLAEPPPPGRNGTLRCNSAEEDGWAAGVLKDPWEGTEGATEWLRCAVLDAKRQQRAKPGADRRAKGGKPGGKRR